MGHHLAILKANINDVNALEAEIAALSPNYVVHLAGISFVASKDHEAFYWQVAQLSTAIVQTHFP